jgi:hypothetical protein
MSIDVIDDDTDPFLQQSDWLKNSKALELQKRLESRITNTLFNHDPTNIQFQQMMVQFACFSREPTKRAFLKRDIKELKLTHTEAIFSIPSLISNLPDLPFSPLISPPVIPWTDLHNAVLSGPLTPTESDSPISKKYNIAGKIGPHYIGWINGMANSFDDFKASGLYIQKLAGGSQVSGIYNHSHTIAVDLLEAACLNHLFEYSPVTAKLLQKEWQDFHEYNADNPNAKLLQICHSQGAIHVKNALQNCPAEIRDRIIVIAIAPGAIVPDKLCFKAYNYASERDIVYKFEPSRPTLLPGVIDDVLIPRFGDPILPAREELIILPSHPEATGIDHEFISLTFQPLIEKALEHYTERQGQYLPEEKGKYFFNEASP